MVRQGRRRTMPARDPLGRYQLAQVLKRPSVVRRILPVGQRDPRLSRGWNTGHTRLTHHAGTLPLSWFSSDEMTHVGPNSSERDAVETASEDACTLPGHQYEQL